MTEGEIQKMTEVLDELRLRVENHDCKEEKCDCSKVKEKIDALEKMIEEMIRKKEGMLWNDYGLTANDVLEDEEGNEYIINVDNERVYI